MWCGLIKLAYSPGAMITLFSFMSGCLHRWGIVFVCGQLFSFVGSLPHMWVVVVMQVHSSCM